MQNSSSGVDVEVHGSKDLVKAFVAELEGSAPPQARIDRIETRELADRAYPRFEILESHNDLSEFMPVPSDLAICPQCRQELFDPQNRRFRYPFINCTHCGPRYSIIKAIPYDRPNTTMSGFSLCPDCAREYHDPADRRFHAQPIACPVCGPKLWFQSAGQECREMEGAFQRARQLIRSGKILAVQGLGGFHLFCNAFDPAAVQRLRERKKRSLKPFALMAFDLQHILPYVNLHAEESRLFSSPAAPIVLLETTELGKMIRSTAAPDQNRLGIMLAYTPLHLLLLEPEQDFPDLLVATSGNLSEEPICYTQEEAISRLSEIADGFLFHDRPIHHAIDDSVTQIVTLEQTQEYPIRRARGFNTYPVFCPSGPQIFAAGAELKNTFCLAREGRAFLSHHLGDLQNAETLAAYEEAVRHEESLYRVKPQIVVCDLHPDYLSSRFAAAYAAEANLPLIKVQHHHAHLSACMLENHLDPEEAVFGVTYDGTGYGEDGSIWGGEILLGNCSGFQRVLSLTHVPQPGGDAAVREPARMALAYLLAAGIDPDEAAAQTSIAAYLGRKKTALIRAQLKNGFNCPKTSSMGRLFDAVSSLLGIYHIVSYEAQGAVALERIADPQTSAAYPVNFDRNCLNQIDLIPQILSDLKLSLQKSVISAKFHNTIAVCTCQALLSLRNQYHINKVVISGGVWQNLFLLKRTWALLHDSGFEVITHQKIPANDACIALGQVAVALAQTRR